LSTGLIPPGRILSRSARHPLFYRILSLVARYLLLSPAEYLASTDLILLAASFLGLLATHVSLGHKTERIDVSDL
jgi:hypothetical protein